MKNPDTPWDKGNSQNQNTDPKNSNINTNPYDSENLDNESDATSKDITEKDIENDLLENDPSQGFETDINADQNDVFEMTASDRDNPINKEFEIGQLGNEELREDELTRDVSEGGPAPFSKPSERKF